MISRRRFVALLVSLPFVGKLIPHAPDTLTAVPPEPSWDEFRMDPV